MCKQTKPADTRHNVNNKIIFVIKFVNVSSCISLEFIINVLQKCPPELHWSRSHMWRGRSIGSLWAACQRLWKWVCGFPRRAWAGTRHVGLRGIETVTREKYGEIILPKIFVSAKRPKTKGAYQKVGSNAQRSSSWDGLNSDVLLGEEIWTLDPSDLIWRVFSFGEYSTVQLTLPLFMTSLSAPKASWAQALVKSPRPPMARYSLSICLAAIIPSA